MEPLPSTAKIMPYMSSAQQNWANKFKSLSSLRIVKEFLKNSSGILEKFFKNFQGLYTGDGDGPMKSTSVDDA